ncbi:MAG: DNA cytosine methyltransferase [Chloroflexota bacterium]
MGSVTASINVVDFFRGRGGASAGLRAAGCDIQLGLDLDKDAEATFRANFPEASFLRCDIRKLEPEDLWPAMSALPLPGGYLLFSGCAPCQPFSRQRHSVDLSFSWASLDSNQGPLPYQRKCCARGVLRTLPTQMYTT